jgi:hypothetical protein
MVGLLLSRIRPYELRSGSVRYFSGSGCRGLMSSIVSTLKKRNSE